MNPPSAHERPVILAMNGYGLNTLERFALVVRFHGVLPASNPGYLFYQGDWLS